jgi:protein tyrosine phosphatase
MITHEEEKGRVKCARYWPAQLASSVTYGPYTVTLVKVNEMCEDYLVREFHLVSAKNEHKSPPRRCFQFQYLAWSDHGVPENAQTTLDFVDHFNRLYDEIETRAPITVHCSAGIGRTGAIIVIDAILDKIKTQGLNSDIDIYKTVYSLRSQRSGMIQTEKQYQFLYTIVDWYVEAALSRMSAREEAAAASSRHLPGVSYMTSTPKAVSLQSINNIESSSDSSFMAFAGSKSKQTPLSLHHERK